MALSQLNRLTTWRCKIRTLIEDSLGTKILKRIFGEECGDLASKGWSNIFFEGHVMIHSLLNLTYLGGKS